MVRLDLFSHTGKWKYTTALDMKGHYEDTTTVDAVRGAIWDNVRTGHDKTMIDMVDGYQPREMIAVVLEPYHQHSYPVCMVFDYQGMVARIEATLPFSAFIPAKNF